MPSPGEFQTPDPGNEFAGMDVEVCAGPAKEDRGAADEIALFAACGLMSDRSVSRVAVALAPARATRCQPV